MFHYIQIDENGIPVADSLLSGEVISNNMIRVTDNFDPDGKKYENGEWVDYEDPNKDIMSEEEQTELEKTLNIAYMTDLLEAMYEGGN